MSYSAKYHIRSVLSGHYSEVSVISELDEIPFSAPSLSFIMFCQGARPLCGMHDIIISVILIDAEMHTLYVYLWIIEMVSSAVETMDLKNLKSNFLQQHMHPSPFLQEEKQ